MINKKDIISKKQLIENVCGIYFLLDGDEIVYVGQSIKIFSRIGSHCAEGIKVFDSYSFVRVCQSDLDVYETEAILKYKPKYNDRYTGNEKYPSAVYIAAVCDKSVDTIKKLIKKLGIQEIEKIKKMSVYDRSTLDRISNYYQSNCE